MNDDLRLPIELLDLYLKNKHYENDIYKIDIELISNYRGIAFEVSMEIKEEAFRGAFPQRRFSLERNFPASSRNPS